MHIEMNKVT